MTNQNLRGLAPVAFLMFAAAAANLFFPGAIGFVIAFAALLVVAGLAAAADRIAERSEAP